MDVQRLGGKWQQHQHRKGSLHILFALICLLAGSDFALTHNASLCSALAVLASGSGVSTEREAFMDLVKTEIERLNKEVSNRGSVSMVFHSGGVHVSAPVPLE